METLALARTASRRLLRDPRRARRRAPGLRARSDERMAAVNAAGATMNGESLWPRSSRSGLTSRRSNSSPMFWRRRFSGTPPRAGADAAHKTITRTGSRRPRPTSPAGWENASRLTRSLAPFMCRRSISHVFFKRRRSRASLPDAIAPAGCAGSVDRRCRRPDRAGSRSRFLQPQPLHGRISCRVRPAAIGMRRSSLRELSKNLEV